MRNRFACVELCVCGVWGTAIELGCCDHGVSMCESPGVICPCGPLVCHARDESGAEAMRVTFYQNKAKKKTEIRSKHSNTNYDMSERT